MDCLTPASLISDHSWWEIYRDEFPDSERESPQVILTSLKRGVGMAFRASLDGRTAAIATTQLLKNPPAVFLIYLATSKGSRGQGFGSALLEFAWQAGVQRLSDERLSAIGLIAEVDSPDEPASLQEKQIRESRIAFFQRQGCTLLPHSYIQPPIDGSTFVPMRLMFRPAIGYGNPDRAVLNALVPAMYFEKYYEINGIRKETLNQLLRETDPQHALEAD